MRYSEGAGHAHVSGGLLDCRPVPGSPGDRSVGFGDLRRLVVEQLRRGCRRWGFDWEAFVADGPEWGVAEVVHRRAVQRGHARGLDLPPSDLSADAVFGVVRDVISEWDRQPELRPTDGNFHQEQVRRGERGRETQRVLAGGREVRVLALVAEGVSNNAEIARRIGVHRATVGRIRRRVDEASSVEPAPPSEPAPFPAPDIPPLERWPVVQFIRQTGVALDADQARWLADLGSCYEAEGREDDLMRVIGSSAGPGVRDPWAYLQCCIVNRGDAWVVTPQLLADVLSWAGQRNLEYSLTSIGGGYVRRPLPYLREVLSNAVTGGKRPTGWPERPVAMAIGMARQWAPELVVLDPDKAVTDEAADLRSGHVSSFRRRFGRLPWEVEPELSEPVCDAVLADDCCIDLNGVADDEVFRVNNIGINLESSPGSSKADATSVPLGDAPLGHPLGTSGPVLREDQKPILNAPVPSPPAPRVAFSERCPCRHPLALALASAMVLDDVVQVECSTGCGHRLYSDRGPFPCPCHWSASWAVHVARLLHEQVVGGFGPAVGVVDDDVVDRRENRCRSHGEPLGPA